MRGATNLVGVLVRAVGCVTMIQLRHRPKRVAVGNAIGIEHPGKPHCELAVQTSNGYFPSVWKAGGCGTSIRFEPPLRLPSIIRGEGLYITRL